MNYFCLGLLAITTAAASACTAGPGLSQKGLAPCPDTPNCVSSQSRDKQHGIPPLTYKGSPDQAMKTLASIISALPRTRIIEQESDYIHIEFRTRWLKFTDDVEFWLPEQMPDTDQSGIIHLRSASRLGYSDLGANRRRMEKIRVLFEEEQP